MRSTSAVPHSRVCGFRFIGARLRRSIATALASALLSVGWGDTANNDRSLREFEFSVYAIGQTDWNGIYYQPEPGIFRPLQFWTHERSPKHPYHGSLPVEFYARQPDPASPTGFHYSVVGRLVPPAGDKDFLVFFIAHSQTARGGALPPFTLHCLDDSSDHFPIDTITFVNATGALLKGVFGRRALELPLGIAPPIPLNSYFGNETRIGLAVAHEGRMTQVLHSKWTFYPNYREILLLLPPTRAAPLRIQVYRISEHIEALHPPAADLKGRESSTLP